MELNRVLVGDAIELAAQLPRDSVHAIVTSPPYFGQRVYGDDDREVGREEDLGAYVQRIADVFDSLVPALRDDGSLWLNLGDKYVRQELQGAPWAVVFELKRRGWRLRSEIIWHKPNAKPSAVRTRPTVAHEQLFLLTRSKRYYYDIDAIREEHVSFTDRSRMQGPKTHFGVRGGTPEQGKYSGDRNLHQGRWDQAFHPLGRNKRTVWEVATAQCPEAHFAVMPEGLVEPCILAGVPVGGVVLDPFMGAGTVAIVAQRHGRHYLGFELLPEIVELAERRILNAR